MNNKLKVLGILLLVGVAGYLVATTPLTLGLDLQGGARLVLEGQSTDKVKISDDSMNGVLAVIRNRIDALGVSEPIVQRKGSNQIVVELPGVKDPDRAIKIIGDTALLEFTEAEWPPSGDLELSQLQSVYGAESRIASFEVVENGHVQSTRPIILKKTVLTGADLKGAWPSVDEYGNPIVDIEFNPNGAQIFADVTSRTVNQPIAILLDKKIISAPNVREPIPNGKAQISGSFTIEEVQDLVIKLKAGALPLPVQLVETRIVGPTLGRDSIEKSKFAGLIGLAFIIFFMIAYYRYPGMLAIVALSIYGFLTYAILVLLGATLTLPGIAGFLLSIGMAVDANIIIFERLKEESRAGKTIRAAIDTSFDRALSAILDSNVTTLIAAAILFWLGTGTIKGFAVTLTVGILVSMFTAIIITRLFLELSVDGKILKDAKSRLILH